jgi:hypothetical protein
MEAQTGMHWSCWTNKKYWAVKTGQRTAEEKELLKEIEYWRKEVSYWKNWRLLNMVVGDGHRGPLKNREKTHFLSQITKHKWPHNHKTRPRWSRPNGRGPRTWRPQWPTRTVSPSPHRAKLHFARGIQHRTNETSPRSRAGHPLGRDSASLEALMGSPLPHMLPRPEHLMFRHMQALPSQRWIRVMPSFWHRLGIISRRCFANPPGEAIPTTVQHCAVRPPVSAPWHCATHSCAARAPHPRKTTAKPSKRGRTPVSRPPKSTPWRRTSEARLLRHHQPCAAVPATTTPSRALQHHPRHWGSTGRPDTATPATVHLTTSRQPHPRVSVRTTTREEAPTPLPSKPLLDGYRARHDALPEARFARTAVNSTTLHTMPLHVIRTVRHDCKLPPLGL